VGIIRFIGSGRVQVDFNHKFAGRTLVYDVEVTRKLEDDNDKVLFLIKRRLPIDDQKIRFTLENSNIKIDLPEETFLADGIQIIKRAIANDIFKYIPRIESAGFVETYLSQPAESRKPEEPKKEQPKTLEKDAQAAQPQAT
jgi:peptidylprolyl isomerase